jgi:tetratricopeptide (TPR) repeat protein
MKIKSILVLLIFVSILSSGGQENTAKHWLKRGLVSKDSNSFVEAIDYFEKAISLDPSCAEAWYWKGYCLVETDNKDDPNFRSNKEAIDCFNNAIKINTFYVDAYIDKSFSEAQIGMYDEALKTINKALEIDPDNSDALSGKGIVFYFLKDYDEAFKWYDKAKEADPNNANPWYNEGETYESRDKPGDDNKADVAYKKASLLTPAV